MIDKVLVIDDECLIRDLMEDTISRHGIEVVTANSGEEGIEVIKEQHDFQMCFCDMRMNKLTGIDVLRFSKGFAPDMVFVLMTAYGSIETAVEAMRLGAFDFIIKPFTPDQTDVLIEKAKQWLQINRENEYLRKEVSSVESTGEFDTAKIFGGSYQISRALQLADRVANTDATVLITGESGTGKELIAGEIHRISDPDNKNPYIRMNCAAVPENLLESELFGHEKGAFTGATERRIGRFELADGGTLLLDEIGEISPNMQAKLLRVLQESEFERVGGTKTITVKVRVLATTNRNLMKEVSEGNFREDLYYRLNVFPIQLTPLRDRGNDISIIAKRFLKRQSAKLSRPLSFSAEALQCMQDYHWPGNIRELENIVERVAILEDGPVITAEALPREMHEKDYGTAQNLPGTDINFMYNIREIERLTIIRSLKETRGNRTKAAELLGFTTRTLRNKLVEYEDAGIWDEDFDPKKKKQQETEAGYDYGDNAKPRRD